MVLGLHWSGRWVEVLRCLFGGLPGRCQGAKMSSENGREGRRCMTWWYCKILDYVEEYMLYSILFYV